MVRLRHGARGGAPGLGCSFLDKHGSGWSAPELCEGDAAARVRGCKWWQVAVTAGTRLPQELSEASSALLRLANSCSCSCSCSALSGCCLLKCKPSSAAAVRRAGICQLPEADVSCYRAHRPCEHPTILRRDLDECVLFFTSSSGGTGAAGRLGSSTDLVGKLGSS